MDKLILHINHPTSDFCLAGNAMKIEVFAMQEQKHCDYEYILQLLGEKKDVFIKIDDKFVAVARHVNDKKATYIAKLNLENISEGTHTLKALFSNDNYKKTSNLIESAPVVFVIDKTPPFIRSVFPSNIVRFEDADASNIIVEAEDVHSGIDVNKCIVTIDDIPCLKPSEIERGIVFPTRIKPDNQTHKMDIDLTDLAGNNTRYESEFTISNIPQFVSSLIIETEDACSGIDVDKCTATLDENPLERPAMLEKGIAFPVAKELEAGPHKLKAIISDKAGNKTEYESEVVMDSSTPFITSDIIVEAEKPISELDLQRCSISIDDQPPHTPSHERKCLIFPLEMKLKDLGEGPHKIKVSISDMAGNFTEYKAEFSVNVKEAIDDQVLVTIPDKEDNLILPKDVRLDNESQDLEDTSSEKEVDKIENVSESITEAESLTSHIEMGMDEESKVEENADEYDEIKSRENILNNLREKLIIDHQFLKKWLKSPHDTAAEIGLSYTSEIERFLPPSPSDEYIDFSIKTDNENVTKIIDSLMTRVSASLKEKVPSILEPLKKDGSTKNGNLTNSAKDFINAILQDPVGILQDIGIALTDEEKDAIFPPFSKKNAEALTRWISMVQSDKLQVNLRQKNHSAVKPQPKLKAES